MSDDINQASFASILAGVRKMREAYEPEVPETATTADRNVPDSANNAPVPASAPPRADNAVQARETTTTPNVPKPVNPLRRGNLSTHDGTPTGMSSASNSGARSAPRERRGPRGNVHSYTAIQVAHSQKGNPLLECPLMKLTPWAYNAQILLDYYINATVQVLFLSLKYHKLRPEYVWRRLEKLKGGSSVSARDEKDESLRVLLVVVDIDSPQEVLRGLLVLCLKNDLSMVVAWSFEEAGNYIACLKTNELARLKVELSIQGVKKGDFKSNVVNTLTTVRAVNKTDVANLLANCKSFKEIVLRSTRENGLAGIHGLGERKIHNLHAAFAEPFIFNKEYNGN